MNQSYIGRVIARGAETKKSVLFVNEKKNGSLCCWPLNAHSGITFKGGCVYQRGRYLGTGMMQEEMQEYVVVVYVKDNRKRVRIPVELLSITGGNKAYLKQDAAVRLPRFAQMVLSTGAFKKINP